MSDHSSLHSRLRVLIAKTFKAERLYSSMRNSHAFASDKQNAVLDLSNDTRAREWQRCHFLFRQILNDLLSTSPTSALSTEVAGIRDRFRAESKSAAQEVRAGAKQVIEAAKREEFSQMVKVSLELVKAKARAEASCLIADELDSMLGHSPKKTAAPATTPVASLASLEEELAAAESEQRSVTAIGSNVVPFRKTARR